MLCLKRTCIVFHLFWLLSSVGLLAVPAYGEAGLIVETPTGLLGFLSDVGHSSVWISHGCLSKQGEVRYCEHSAGIVLSSTAYWSDPGTAAIPAELFSLGAAPGAAGRSLAAWQTTLGPAYPAVQPSYGRKYLGRVWRRGMRVTTFATTPEQDRKVLAEVERGRKLYRYSYSHHNCAFYAQQVLQLYLGQGFHARRMFDAGVYTPRALERSLMHDLRSDPAAQYRLVVFRGTLLQSWRQPPRNFCESALFDPKYAVPLVLFQPHLYAGFGVCYGLTRLSEATWRKTPPNPPILAFAGVAANSSKGSRLLAYQQLTGVLPTGVGWLQARSAGEAQQSQQTIANQPTVTDEGTAPALSGMTAESRELSEDAAQRPRVASEDERHRTPSGFTVNQN